MRFEKQYLGCFTEKRFIEPAIEIQWRITKRGLTFLSKQVTAFNQMLQQ